MRNTMLLPAAACLIVILTGTCAWSQPVPVEVMAGNNNYLYQHSFSKRINSGHFSFFHTSSLYAYYTERSKPELMSQSYITYRLHRNVKIALGTFYASKPGFKPSAAVQFSKKISDLFVLLVPRIDLWKNPSAEAMVLAEYRPNIVREIDFYSKVQLMSNYGSHHNRSYQNIRVGLSISQTQFGIALNVDEFGSEKTTTRNLGLFLRHEFK